MNIMVIGCFSFCSNNYIFLESGRSLPYILYDWKLKDARQYKIFLIFSRKWRQLKTFIRSNMWLCYKIDSVILNENNMNNKVLASKVPNTGAYIL